MDRRLFLLSTLLAAGCDPSRGLRALRDPRAAAEAELAAYLSNPEKIERDAKALKARLDQLFTSLRGFARDQWGEEDTETAGTKRYVKYTEEYRTRIIVDFENNLLRVETIDQARPYAALESALVIALLTPDDPASVDLFSAKPITLGGKPYLFDLIHDDRGQPISRQSQAERFANRRVVRDIELSKLKNDRTVYHVTLPLRPKVREVQARKFEDIVMDNSRRFGIDPALILAVIEVESAFNPFAVSHAPAFGLMQLVPSTGGRDAMRFVYKQDRDPTPNELFRVERNIELGTAYLHMLGEQYLKDISNPLSRTYAVIAAYNGGAGNLFKMFGGKPGAAMRAMNRLKPQQLYRRINTHHGAAETRNYIRKVVTAWRRYQKAR
ncbi:MAG: murein transglycosylase domain-containing protein [Gammaproteobacteria bacterium]